MVFFEAPHRAAATLAAMRDAWGPGRRAAACRELTKVYEEVFRGTLDELCSWAEGGLRGELTIVVAGISAGAGTVAASEREPAALARAVAEAEAGGLDRRTAITEVAVRVGVPRKVVYQAVIDARSAT